MFLLFFVIYKEIRTRSDVVVNRMMWSSFPTNTLLNAIPARLFAFSTVCFYL